MDVNYLNAVAAEDAVAETWVERRGRSLAFCGVEVRPERKFTTSASLVYKT